MLPFLKAAPFAVLLLTALVPAHAEPTDPDPATRQAVLAQIKKWDAAQVAGDAAAVANIYMPQFTYGGQQPTSRAQMLAQSAAEFKQVHFPTWTTTVVSLKQSDGKVIEISHTSASAALTDPKGKKHTFHNIVQGTDRTTWVQSGGTWRVADTWHTSASEILNDLQRAAPDGKPGVAADSFDGTPGMPLRGQKGGTGWAGPWLGTGPTITPVGLSDPSEKLKVGAHATDSRLAGGDQLTAGRNLAFLLGADGTTEWISFIIARTSGAMKAYGGLTFALEGGLFVGDTGDDRWGMDTAGTDVRIDAGPVKNGKATFLVVRADFKPGTDTFTLYQDPTPGLDAPDVKGVVKSDLKQPPTSLVELVFGNFNPVGLQAYTIGDLRLGPTFASVSPARP